MDHTHGLTRDQVSVYSLVALIFCLLTWFDVWTHADVVRVGDRTELIVSTLAASVGIVTSLLGWAGILLNNRGFLAVYNVLLWVMLAMIAAPGYLTYKRRTFNLEGKVNAQWSRNLGLNGRLRIQNSLNCCGYFSPFVEATVSQTCYARSILPGCKDSYLKFERKVLERWYIVAFAIVPVHIAGIFAALLCSNHVTYRFGKGMMPKAYRLSMNSMAVIMDNYAKYVFHSSVVIISDVSPLANWPSNTAQMLPRSCYIVLARICNSIAYPHSRTHLAQARRLPLPDTQPRLAVAIMHSTRRWAVLSQMITERSCDVRIKSHGS